MGPMNSMVRGSSTMKMLHHEKPTLDGVSKYSRRQSLTVLVCAVHVPEKRDGGQCLAPKES